MVLALEPAAPARKADGFLVGALMLILIADFAFPLRRVLSPLLLGLVSALALPWARIVLRGGRAGPEMSRSVEAWAFRVAVLAIAAIVLVAKWWLLGESAASDAEHFV